MWGNVPGGYRNTINDNVVLILMIETLEGLKNADAIAKVPGVTAVFAASGDLGNFSGYRQGSADYERAINIVHDAAIKAGVRLCGPLAWRPWPCLPTTPSARRKAPSKSQEKQRHGIDGSPRVCQFDEDRLEREAEDADNGQRRPDPIHHSQRTMPEYAVSRMPIPKTTRYQAKGTKSWCAM